MSIGKQIKIARKRKKLSQIDLSKLSGISHASISRFENNARNPSINDLRLLSIVLNVSSDFLLDLNNNLENSLDQIEARLNILEKFINS